MVFRIFGTHTSRWSVFCAISPGSTAYILKRLLAIIRGFRSKYGRRWALADANHRVYKTRPLVGLSLPHVFLARVVQNNTRVQNWAFLFASKTLPEKTSIVLQFAFCLN